MLDVIQNKIRNQIRSWYPLYANGTLLWPKRWVVRLWLSRKHIARSELRAIQSLQASVRDQPILTPRPETLLRIQARVQSQYQTSPMPSRQWQLWAIPLGLLIVAGILLWQALPPVITLAWSAQGQEVETFRVYRGIAGEKASLAGDNFILVNEVPADSIDNTYTFTDAPLLPGNNIIYRIDAVDEQGLLATTKTLTGNGINALLGQVTLMVIGIFIVYVLWYLLRQGLVANNPNWYVLN